MGEEGTANFFFWEGNIHCRLQTSFYKNQSFKKDKNSKRWDLDSIAVHKSGALSKTFRSRNQTNFTGDFVRIFSGVFYFWFSENLDSDCLPGDILCFSVELCKEILYGK